MAEGVKYTVSLDVDTKPFAASAEQAVQTMRHAGHRTGESFGDSLEHSLHAKVRGLHHVITLFGGVLGGAMGSAFGKSFDKTLAAGLGGALGGAFLTPSNVFLGFGIGGVVGIISELVLSAGEKTKKLHEISEKFKLSFQDIKEFAKSGIEPDELAKSLEHWKELLAAIAEKNPEVIKGLKQMGIEGEDAFKRLARQPPEVGEQILARQIAKTMPELMTTISEKRKRFEEENQQAKDAAIRAARTGGIGSGQPFPERVADKDLTSEEVNKILKTAPAEKSDEFVRLVKKFPGGLDQFLKVLNKGPLELGPLSPFEAIAAGQAVTPKTPGFGTKDLPTPDSLAKSGLFLTGGVGGENYAQTQIGLLSQIATKVDGVKEAVKSHERTTKEQ